MRKIGFRGKRLTDGAWVHGYLYKSYAYGSEMGGTWILSNMHGSEPRKIKVLESTVGECTGLRDSNGRTVFEGDVVEALFNPVRLSDDPEVILGVVEWWSERAEFCVNCLSLQGSDLQELRHRSGYKFAEGRFAMTFATKGRVIGNIHDNAK